ncbi:hypothetical protein [Bradyrhizobium barranii]
MIDMRKYASETYVTIPDVRGGSLSEKIANAREGKYDKPEIVFESGDVLSLNATNRKTLMRAYGPTSDTWIGKEVELVLGEVTFENKPQEAVIVRPISPPLTTEEKTAAAAVGSDMNDDIPF